MSAWPGPSRCGDGGTVLRALVFLVALSQTHARTERARAALDEANRALRDCATQSEEFATARERNRIAREIHDGLGHSLTAIHMQIQAGDRQRRPTPGHRPAVRPRGARRRRRSGAALRAERQATPVALAGLARTAESVGLGTMLTAVGVARPLAPQPEQALSRAAQED